MRDINQIRRIISMFALTLVLSAGNAWADIVVVVGKDTNVALLTAEDVRDIFLGKESNFPGGSKAHPVYQDEKQPIYERFSQEVLGKDPAKLRVYWSSRIFSGKGHPPKSVTDDAAVKAHVTSTPGGTGYIDSANVDASVKVLFEGR